jgi:hypothetical protein
MNILRGEMNGRKKHTRKIIISILANRIDVRLVTWANGDPGLRSMQSIVGKNPLTSLDPEGN